MTVLIEMFWVPDGNRVTVCRTQQYLVADCSMSSNSHSEQSVSLRQLNTATGGHRADRWVMTADVVADLQPGSEEPYRSVNDRRLSPAWTEHAPWPTTSGNWRVCRWCGRSVVDRRWIVRQRWALTAGDCTARLESNDVVL